MYGYTREQSKTVVRGVVHRHWIVKDRKGVERFRIYRKSPLSIWIKRVNRDQEMLQAAQDLYSNMRLVPYPPHAARVWRGMMRYRK